MTETQQAQGTPEEPEQKPGKAGRWIFIIAAVFVLGLLGIGCLATLVVPGIIGRLNTAFREKAQADIFAIESAVDLYHLDRAGVWPASLEELVQSDSDGVPYLEPAVVPLDPWGVPYGYEPPTGDEERARIYSYGKDGRPGGEGVDADVTNRR